MKKSQLNEYHPSFKKAISKVYKKQNAVFEEEQKHEKGLLSQSGICKTPVYPNDVNNDEIDYFNRFLYSSEELETFNKLAKQNNFSIKKITWNWISLLIKMLDKNF